MTGIWYEDSGFELYEEKHPTGYALQLLLKQGYFSNGAVLTVPQAEKLADALTEWVKVTREGGHYERKAEGSV